MSGDDKDNVKRYAENIRDEIVDEKPDESRVAGWLDKTKKIITIGSAGAELYEAAQHAWELFQLPAS